MSGAAETSAETKHFHIGDILSIISDRLVSPNHIGGVYEILGWLVDEPLMTHQLPRVIQECQPFLREAFPDLAAIDVASADLASAEACLAWLNALEMEHGSYREVPRVPKGYHQHIDPITELLEMRPDAPVVVVSAT